MSTGTSESGGARVALVTAGAGGIGRAVAREETEHLAGQAALAFSGLHEFVRSDEAREALRAFDEKRPPDFAPYRARASRSL